MLNNNFSNKNIHKGFYERNWDKTKGFEGH